MKIQINSAYIDFYVNKKQFDKYKTEKGRFSFVKRELDKVFAKLNNTFQQGLEIRDVSTTSNDFWGQRHICTINDIGYRIGFKPKLREDVVTVRYFSVEIISIVLTDTAPNHPTIKGKGFRLACSSCKHI